MNFMIRNRTVVGLHDVSARDNDVIQRHEYIAYSHIADAEMGPHPASSATDYLRRVHQLNEAMTRQVHKMHSLTTVASIAGIFVFITVITTALVAVFCCKRNAVFAMPNKSDDEYEDCELDDLELGTCSDDEKESRTYRTFENPQNGYVVSQVGSASHHVKGSRNKSNVHSNHSNNNTINTFRKQADSSNIKASTSTCDYFLVPSQRLAINQSDRSFNDLEAADSRTRLVRSTSAGLDSGSRFQSRGGRIASIFRRNRDWILNHTITLRRSNTGAEMRSVDQTHELTRTTSLCHPGLSTDSRWGSYTFTRSRSQEGLPEKLVLRKTPEFSSVIYNSEFDESCTSLHRVSSYRSLSSESEISQDVCSISSRKNVQELQSNVANNIKQCDKSASINSELKSGINPSSRTKNTVSNDNSKFKYKQLQNQRTETRTDSSTKKRKKALGLDLNGSLILGDVEDYQWPVEEDGLRLHGDIME